MPSTLDPTPERGVFLLLKGESGAGKSDIAYSFPTPYVFDFDEKMPSIALKHFPGKKIEWDTFPDIFAVSDRIEQLRQSCPYETLVFDSLTSLVVKTLNTIGKVKGDEVVKMLKKLTAGGNIELMGIDYYNGETNFIQRYFIEALKSLWSKPGNPKHVILIAHVITTESAPDLKTKQTIVTRSIVTAGRKVAAYVPTQFDEMWHIERQDPDFGATDKTPKRICITQGLGEDEAKTALRIPQAIDFTNKSMYDRLVNEFGVKFPKPDAESPAMSGL